MNPMMGGAAPQQGPPAGGQDSMLLAALMGGNPDSLGGDPLAQIMGDFPLQDMAPPLDDGMLNGGFPALNLLGGGMGGMADPMMLQSLLGGPQQMLPPQQPLTQQPLPGGSPQQMLPPQQGMGAPPAM